MGIFSNLKEFFLGRKVQVKVEDSTKPKKVMKIGNTTIVIKQDGTTISTEEDVYDDFRNLGEEEIQIWFDNKNTISQEESFPITKNDLSLFELHDDFEVEGNSVYVKGVRVKMPEIVVAKFIQLLDSDNFNEEEYQSFLKFWLQLVNSPLTDIGKVLKYVQETDSQITPNGNIVVYRRVYEHGLDNQSDVDLYKFVNDCYKAIRLLKKGTKNYNVWRSRDSDKLECVKHGKEHKLDDTETWDIMGNLKELKVEEIKPGTMLYTSSYNRGKYTFPIPGLYKADKEDRNINGRLCQNGSQLHSGGRKSYSFNGFGDIEIVGLVSPQKCTIVPCNGEGKMTSSEIYCVKVIPFGYEATLEDIKEADELYFDMNVQELKQIAESKDLSSLCSQDGGAPDVSVKDLKEIVNILQSRVKEIA